MGARDSTLYFYGAAACTSFLHQPTMRTTALAPWLVGTWLVGASLTAGLTAFADDEGAKPASEESADAPADSAPSEGASKSEDGASNWGVGDSDSEGQFKPSGKTGRLKELEDAVEKERVTEATPLKMGGPGNVWVDTSFAPSGSMIVPIQEVGPATAVAPGVSFVIGASYRIRDKWELGARVGLGSAATDGPRTPLLDGSRDPDAFKQIAMGNVELSLRPFFKLTPTTVLPIGLALVVPTAMGDMFADPDGRIDLARWNVNQASSAMRGWDDRALWEPNRFGIVPSAGIVYQRPMGEGALAGELTVEGRTKFEIMALTGGKDPSVDPSTKSAVGDVKDVALNWVLGGGASYAMFGGLLQPGLKAWLAYATPTSTLGTLDNAGAQFVLEPGVATSVSFTQDRDKGLKFIGRIAGTFPVGGPLGAGNAALDAGIAALRVTTGLNY
ncbi:MAG: hypothetical protein FJ095_18990 [Deltaproteobacteria bacterium]|nr:hypothetical protein [Deltaproteobacteria bacterium]